MFKFNLKDFQKFFDLHYAVELSQVRGGADISEQQQWIRNGIYYHTYDVRAMFTVKAKTNVDEGDINELSAKLEQMFTH